MSWASGGGMAAMMAAMGQQVGGDRAGQTNGGSSSGMMDGMSEAEHKAHEIRVARLRDSSTTGSREGENYKAGNTAVARADWASSYQMWNDWQDEEMYQEKLAREKERINAVERRSQIAGCNHDHSAERNLVEKSTRTKLDECAQFREEGNAWFQEGQYFRASEKYRRVTIWLDYTFPSTDEEQEEINRVHLPALVNQAICFLKLDDPVQAVEHARRALELDPQNIKAMYCRAKAYRLMDNIDEASKYLKEALALAPDHFELRKEAAMLRNMANRYREDTKLRAQAMFHGSAAPPAPPSSMQGLRHQLLRIG
mmetsp:Transcript_13753/g.26657  ORF Transcript_13753/g.26657 Transcript_13753/m.26657 type:complete len:312 (+) Transcript_13753:150-1085(+)